MARGIQVTGGFGGLQGAFSSYPAICKVTDAMCSHEIYR
jgi:hypothetical protein